jgi:hypothetical protein
MKDRLLLLGACAAILAAASPTFAAKGVGCDGFLWPLATELAWIRSDDSTKVASGISLPTPPTDKAIELVLLPAAKVRFATTPTSTPKPEDATAFGGIVNFEKVPEPGQYQVTLSVHGWIDVVQNGAPLEAIGHTGADGCDAARKSVRFEIGPGPVSIQVNGIRKDTVKFTIRPAAD